MATATGSIGDIDALREALGAVARGDRIAFESLYRATSAKLFGVCLRILPKRDEAEDVLQETYTTVWRKAASYDSAVASPITWLVSIARNKAIDRARAGAGDRALDPIDAANDIVDARADATARSELDSERRRLDHCMDELEPDRRALVRVAFFEGITYDELSRRESMPLGTVKSWIRRSLQKLKACLER